MPNKTLTPEARARHQALDDASEFLERTAADYLQMAGNIKGYRTWDNIERNRLKEQAKLLQGQAQHIRNME